MPDPRITVVGQSFSTFHFLVALAVILSAALIVARYRGKLIFPAGRIADAVLAAVIAGIIGARLGYVLQFWTYYRDHRAEIAHFSAGGLDPYGAWIGATMAFWLVGHRRGLRMAWAWEVAAWALVAISLAAWWGCGANHCAYGREVQTLADYPAWLVWEERDLSNSIAPRFATQPLGMMATLGIGLLLFGLARGDHRRGQRYALTAFLLIGVTLALDALRGDMPLSDGAILRRTEALIAWGGAALWSMRPVTPSGRLDRVSPPPTERQTDSSPFR